jgi:predicted alpha/beta superfamily hydrolase
VKKAFLVFALMVTVLLSPLTQAAAQDAVKAEIRQAIDAAYLNALNGRDIKTFLAGWHQGAVVASLSPTGEVSYQPVIDFANAAAKDIKQREKKEFTYLYPAIDVTGTMGMAHVEVMRGAATRFTGYLPVVKTRTGWKIVGYTFYFHETGARPETPAGEADAVKKVVEDTLVRGLHQNRSKEQVLAGISPGCDVSQYDPERDIPPGWGMPNGVVTKVKLPPEFRPVSGGIGLAVKTSTFTLIGITGHAAAGKLAVTLAPPAPTQGPPIVITMYVALYKLETGWKIAQITEGDEIVYPALAPSAPAEPQSDRVRRAKHDAIVSKVLGEEQTLLISLPDAYERSADKYPVLYVLGGSVRALAEADIALRQPGAPPMIVVAVATPTWRRDDGFGVWLPGPGSPGAERYLRFISEELFPYIEQHFRVQNHRTLYGGSAAGLFVLYALLEQPDAFAAYIASSPTVHYCYDYMAGKATSPSRPLPRRLTQLYIVYGDKDPDPGLPEGLAKYRPILEALRSKTFSVTIEDLPEEGHVPNGSLAKGLKHVFDGRKQP